MKRKTWKLCLACVCCAMLCAAAVGYCFAAGAFSAHAPEAAMAAAMPPAAEQTAPEKAGTCTVCGADAYVINTLPELAYVLTHDGISSGGGGHATSGCYLLNLDADITGWSDAGWGEDTDAAAFTGHFDGLGHTVTYEVTGDTNKIGLFPRLIEARVQNLNLNAAVTPKDTFLLGALACHAQKSTVTGVNASVTYPDGAQVSGAGLAAYVDAESVVSGCSVTVSAGPASLAFRTYGGIALENEGTLSGCSFTLRGVSASLAEFGGIARLNYGAGEILDAKSVLAGLSGARVTVAGDNVGGVVSLLAGGTVSGAGVYLDLTENAVCGNFYNTGGVAANINPELAGKAAAPVLLENCVAEGPVLAGERNIGGIVGNSSVSQTENVTLNACVSKIQTVKSYYTIETDARPEDADGAGSNARVGGVFGSCEVRNRTLLTDCVSYSNIYGQHVLGGILACVAYGETRGAEPNTFTMKNSHCYAEEIVANADGYGCGGIMSHLFLIKREPGLLNHQTTITDCTSYADITAYKQYCGGAIGYYDVQTENPKADMKYHFQNVHVYGNVTVKPAAGTAYSGFGGFFGSVVAANLRVADCSANGSVGGVNDEGTNAIYRAGGFIGTQYNVAGVDGIAVIERCYATGNVTARHNAAGFAADCRGMTFKDCKATGNILGGTDSGGFAGCSRSNYMENCVATGSVTALDFMVSTSFGGFAGMIPQGGTYLNCFAYGDVTSSGTSYGGFAGVINQTAAAENLTMTNCGAFGYVSHTAALVSSGEGGGFVGLINGIKGSVKLDKCFANGSVKGFRVGGFFGLMNNSNSNDVTFTDCVARGDVNARQNQNVGGYEIGGFFGAFAAVKGGTRFTRCESYGSVWNATGNDASYDTGGFGGWLTADTENVTLASCNSYAKELTGTHIDAVNWSVGGLLGGVGTTKVTITNCKYTTPGGVAMVGSWNGYSAPATATGNTVTAAAANTRPVLNCSISASGTNVSVAFTNLANISGYVTDFAVSLDGGRTYTVLIYTSRDNAVKGMMLTKIAGATNALGQFTAQNFTYVLKNLGAYPAGKISVRIAFSDGFSATYQK